MRRTPNYRQERAQKDRVRESRKQQKLQRLEEASARRKAERESVGGGGGDAAGGTAEAEQTAETGRE